MGSRATPLLIGALIVLGCSGGSSPTPGGILEIRDELGRRGVIVISAISGASACPGQPLGDNALHLRVTGPSDGERDVYLYLFRPREFDDTAEQMEGCVSEYAASLAGGVPERAEVAPYRALGAGWSVELKRAIEEALAAAAG